MHSEVRTTMCIFLFIILKMISIEDKIREEQNEVGGVEWSSRILKTYQNVDKILNSLVIFLTKELPKELKLVYSSIVMGNIVEKGLANYIWDSIDIGKFLQNAIGRFLLPTFVSNHKSFYPDF